MNVRAPWSAKAEKDDGTGQPVELPQNNLSGARTQHALQDGTMTKLGLLKSGKLINRWMIERGNPLFFLGHGHESQSSFSHEKTKHVILEEEESHVRTEQPVVHPQRGTRLHQFIIGDDETELNLSLGSKSFLDMVNDQVRQRQKRSSMNVPENDEKHSMIWRVFSVCNIGISRIHGKELLRQLSFHHEYKRLHIETNVRHVCKISV